LRPESSKLEKESTLRKVSFRILNIKKVISLIRTAHLLQMKSEKPRKMLIT